MKFELNHSFMCLTFFFLNLIREHDALSTYQDAISGRKSVTPRFHNAKRAFFFFQQTLRVRKTFLIEPTLNITNEPYIYHTIYILYSKMLSVNLNNYNP